MKGKVIPFKISFERYIRLRTIFKNNRWSTNTNIFNNYGRMLERLNDEHQELVLFLTEDFLHCPHDKYTKFLTKALVLCNLSFFVSDIG
jgi:hypothetical protein